MDSEQQLNSLPQELQDKIKFFLEDHNINRISTSVRMLLITYLRHHHMDGFPIDFDDVLNDVEDLFELLDVMAMHAPKRLT